MSESETTGTDRTGLTDSPASEAKRYPDGMAVIAELRARATKQVADAERIMKFYPNPLDAVHQSAFMLRSAYNDMQLWLDELSGCDVASSDEAGGRNS